MVKIHFRYKRSREISLAEKKVRSPWRARVLGAAALSLVPMMAMQGTANAASCVKFDGHNNYTAENQHWTKWNGSLRSPSHGGGYRTYNAGVDWKGKRYNRVLWQGEPYHCNPAAKECAYRWGHSKSVTTQWSVGLDLGAGRKGKIWDLTAGLTPSYSKTSSVSENFQWDITLRPGQWAKPYLASRMEPQAGFIRGAWKSPGENGTKCSYRGGRGQILGGYSAEWDPTGVVTRWYTNVRQWDFSSYFVWR